MMGARRDAMDPARGQALLAALDRPRAIWPGDPLPPFFHHLHFWEECAGRDLGEDGHPRLDDELASLGLPRRMWAGGELAFHAPLRAGIPAEMVTERDAPTRKSGRSGEFAVVAFRHAVRQEGRLCLTERQDIVYREPPGASNGGPPPPRATREAEASADFAPDIALLFRYSALTYNAHRIHYDERYAREVAGHDGLVVHGPLLAQMLMLMAEDRLGPLAGFRYRATAPLLLGEAASLCAAGTEVWVEGPDRRLCMTGDATPTQSERFG